MLRFFTRLRFLPATIFAASLMLTIKIGNIWEDLDSLVDGAISVAGAEAQQPQPAQPPAPLPPMPEARTRTRRPRRPANSRPRRRRT